MGHDQNLLRVPNKGRWAHNNVKLKLKLKKLKKLKKKNFAIPKAKNIYFRILVKLSLSPKVVIFIFFLWKI